MKERKEHVTFWNIEEILQKQLDALYKSKKSELKGHNTRSSQPEYKKH